MTQACAPVAIFAYNRPDHLRRCIESLLANPEASTTDVVIFCDGPKNEQHRDGVVRTRAIVQDIKGFRSVTTVLQQENFGLAPSIIAGVSNLLEKNDRVIVVEDDLVLSPYFLRYINDGLNLYAKDERIASIQGYFYPVEEQLPETFFLRGTDCFGWGTWKRAWDLFESDSEHLLSLLDKNGLTRSFDLDGSYSYTRMLKAHAKGSISSWAVRWHASAYVHGLLSLYPGRSLVLHTGDDKLATHAENTSWLNGPVSRTAVAVEPIAVTESVAARDSLVRFFRTHNRISWERIVSFATRKIKNLSLS